MKEIRQFYFSTRDFFRSVFLRAKSSCKSMIGQIYTKTRSFFFRLPIPISLRNFLRKVIRCVIPLDYIKRISKINTVTNKTEDLCASWRRTALEHCLLVINQKSQSTNNIRAFFTLPFFSTGGAELVTANFLKLLNKTYPQDAILLILTDKNLCQNCSNLSPNVILINFPAEFPEMDDQQKKMVLFDLIIALQPSLIHNINSDVMWNLIIEKGDAIRKISHIFCSIFAFQFDSHGKRIGYAEYYLREAMKFVSGIISDNKRFIDDAIHIYNLEKERSKFFLIYTPTKALSNDIIKIARDRISRYPSKENDSSKTVCLWAGRIDLEKRIDLFFDIVKSEKDVDFEMYGQQVVDSGLSIPSYPNLKFMGAFSDTKEIFLKRSYSCLLFTSKWEGMPNMIIETGCWGVPIIAPTVGGIGELLNEDTGFPLPEKPSVRDYLVALSRIQKDPHEALMRANNMIELIFKRHNWNQFENNVRQIPNYLDGETF